MRRIVMFNRVTLDGNFAGRDDGLDWIVPEPELDEAAASHLGDADTILFGRRTYEMFASFWPHALDDAGESAPNPHGRPSPAMRKVAVWLNDATKLVFSKKLKHATWNNSRVVRDLNPREIQRLKDEPGKNIMVFGSGSIVSALTEQGLIDEYQIVIGPLLLASDRPLFRGLSKSVRLELTESKAYPSGNVMLRYARS
ncbi:MAG: dihydrofolate reductase family protein [Polyangiales bacterium]